MLLPIEIFSDILNKTIDLYLIKCPKYSNKTLENYEQNLKLAYNNWLDQVLSFLEVSENLPQRLFLIKLSEKYTLPKSANTDPRVDRSYLYDIGIKLYEMRQLISEKPEISTSYVNTSGEVRLPQNILTELNLTNGGGVWFLQHKDNKFYFVLNDEQFLSLFNQPLQDKK